MPGCCSAHCATAMPLTLCRSMRTRERAHSAIDEPGGVGIDRLAPESHQAVHFLDE